MRPTLFVLGLLTLAMGCSSIALAAPPVVQSVTSAPPSAGNPGAQILNLNYTDGMAVVVATYNSGVRNNETPPIGVIAGYGMDISYLHYMAKILNQRGYDVYLVQPPGNGQGEMHSGLRSRPRVEMAPPDKALGYHETIEGFATMYMDGLGQAMANHYKKRTVLLGHSRGGYQVRFFLSGLRFIGNDDWGRPILANSPDALKAAERNFLAVGSLFSPLRADPRLVEAAQRVAASMARVEKLDSMSRRLQEEAPRKVGSAVGWITRLNPLAILAGPLGRVAAEINETVFSNITADAIDAERKFVEERFLHRFIQILSGESELSSDDFRKISMMRRWTTLPSDGEIAADVERARWMLGDADRTALIHTLQHASRRAPTHAAAAEMSRITAADAGLSGWNTTGVDANGKPISVLRALIRARQQSSVLPYAVFAASGDGADQGTNLEERLLRAQIFKVDGSHAATLNGGALRTISDALDNVSEAKRISVRGPFASRCEELFVR